MTTFDFTRLGNLVPLTGPEDAKIAIVGEIPGARDNIKQIPFLGHSGLVLENCLMSAGIKGRDSVLLDNTIPYYYESLPKLYQLPGASEQIEVWKQELVERLAKTSANVIIPVGNLALEALTGETGLHKWRGSILSNKNLPGKKIIPTLHPAVTFNDFAQRYFIIADLERAEKESCFSELRPPNRNLIINPTYEQVINYLAECLRHDIIAFDIETTRTKQIDKFTDWEIHCLSISYNTSHAICIPFLTSYRQDYFSLEREKNIWLLLRKILTDPKISILMQNGMFDSTFIHKKYGFVIGPTLDTIIAQAQIAPGEPNPDAKTKGLPKDLGTLCSLYTDEPYYKDDAQSHKTFDASSKFWKYSARDSAVLFEIYEKQLEEIKNLGNEALYSRTCKLMQMLIKMQDRGILFDVEKLKAASIKELENIQQLRDKLNLVAGKVINANSPKQVKEYFYGDKKIKPYMKKKKPSTDVDALTRIYANYGLEEANLILEIRRAIKYRSTYLEMTLDPDNKARSSFDPVGAATGRLSSRTTIFNTGGNLENLPKKFYVFIKPEPGKALFNIDYSQGENRIVAFCGPEPKMIYAFENDLDVHSLTASMFCDLSPDEITEQNKQGICCELGNGTQPWRHWGKMSNHALNYDIGAATWALKLETKVSVAKELKKIYLESYPGVTRYQRWIQDKLKQDRIITNALGRSRKFYGNIKDYKMAQAAFSHFAQSTIADLIIERLMLPCHYEEQNLEELLNVEVNNQVHDSGMFMIHMELPLDIQATTLKKLAANMERPITWKGKSFSIPTDLELKHKGTTYAIDTSLQVDEIATRLEEVYSI